ncbi:MAG: universal stress protein [Proteobacteria bacterium]|nr:universal stress protein [Pseudomonadota bacterium]
MENKKKTILVTIDHSRQSIDAATYISAMVDPRENIVTLFHVESDLFDIFFDSDDYPSLNLGETSHFSDWMNVQRHSIDENLEMAEKIFLSKDFPKENIRILKQPLTKGITRDILVESQKNYDLLVIGKSGSNWIADGLTGTVTEKLLSRTFHIPLVIIAGTPDTHKVLLGYDGSNGADKAVATSAKLIRSDMSEVQLCHVIRSFNMALAQNTPGYTSFYNTYLPELEEALIKIRREKMEPLLNKACNVFVRHGFVPSTVRWSLINRTASRSQALLDMAKTQECGSLVLGRRGNSAVEEFFMGRVGKKVVQKADSIAVWII